ncbi:ABC transporter permease [Nocardia otitidiscaviarum]|uniref:ABC transporter permease n=1 Tax=Nocardia otitidiscaviarum TaxID=1823 RepID=UPI001892D394|nr:FtsX-like permease family protein [Nocardia otitidiscaviarum]MBF6181184.1 FtsX-like permease family protein [Nocardia otitidiscaviarum]
MLRHPVLFRKIRRELRRRPAQVVAIAVTVLLGVLLFIASYDSFRNLETSYNHTYDRLHLADYTASGGDPEALAAAVRGLDGVDRVMVRTQADVPFTIGDTKLLGRVTGLAAPGAPAVDEIDLTSGALPNPDRPEVVLEHHAADTFGLGAGDSFRIFDGDSWQSVTVTGVARSAEYLWPARSRQEVLADPHSFAVAFAPQSRARALTGRPGPNQTLVEMSDAATDVERDRVTSALRSAGATAIEPQSEQPSNAALREDLSGFSSIAVGFPALFLTAAAIAEYILITRLVQTERPIIGTMLAMGARRRTVVGHYVAYGVAITVAGAVLGVLGGFVATSAVTSAYTSTIGIPDTVVEHRIDTAAIGLALGLLAGLIAALAPAVAAARTAPAQAMRGDGGVPTRPGAVARLSARWTRIPVVVRMAVRSMARGRRRTLATMTGTVLALVLILTSVGMITSMRNVLHLQFDVIELQDATVLVDGRDPRLADELAAVPGVVAVEAGSVTPVTLAAHGNSYSTALNGLPPDTTMHGFRTAAGAPGLPADGLVAGSALADRLDVAVGDTLTVTPAFGAPQDIRLAGLVDEPLGTFAYAGTDTAERIGGTGMRGYLLRFAPDADRDAVRADVTGMPGVTAYTDTHALQAQFDQFLGLFWIFVIVMLVLGAVLAFTVIYVTMTVSFTERTTELATLRATGVPARRITAMLALENLAATALAVPLGLAAGLLSAWAFLNSFDSDMFDIELALGWLAPLLAIAAVLAAAALSQLPGTRMVRGIDVARVVRERAQ